ncbi:MAG: amidohydrolase family protein [Gammaproteobacteria bacterium]
MNTDRRLFLKYALATSAVYQAGTASAAAAGRVSTGSERATATGRGVGYKRIACEEAFITPELTRALWHLVENNPPDDPGFISMWRGIGSSEHFITKLEDLGEGRIADMDAGGIDKQVLMLTAPGVQVFDATTGTALAASSNDQLAEACRNHPDRFAGLTVIAPQDPAAAARELERGMTKLGLKGAIVNSHTHGGYLDDPKYWDIFAAAESLNAPIYIHPTPPPKSMIEPYLSRGLEGPLAGFSAEVYLHTLAIITAGVLDRFPNLKIVIGHLGEGLPYLMYRLDYMQHHAAQPGLRGKKEGLRLKKKISEYMRENLYITTSGMAWSPAIRFAQEVLGVERVLYAMDYPYQFDLEEVIATDEISISFSDKKKLYQLNAERVFSL